MLPLFVAAVALSLTPLLIAFIHTFFGLAWRADVLLARLDTVLNLSALHRRNAAQEVVSNDVPKGEPERSNDNLRYQVFELFNHVKRLATVRKIEDMCQLHKMLDDGAAAEDDRRRAIYQEGKGKYHFRWDKFLARLVEGGRYLIPSVFLCVLYLIGFNVSLLAYLGRCPDPPKDSRQDSVQSGGKTTLSPTAAPPSTAPVARRCHGHGQRSKASSPRSVQHDSGAANAPAPQSGKSLKNLDPGDNKPTTQPQTGNVDSAQSGTSDPKAKWKSWWDDWLAWKQTCRTISPYLIYTFVGAFVYNTGNMVRRVFVWDISGQMFWWSAYRVILAEGLAVVVNYIHKDIGAPLYFFIAALSVPILDNATRGLRAKLFQSETIPKQNELSLQLVQGIDFWKEQRLMEEGIESVQHLATADFTLLALHTRLPLYTIMDWVDQAIFIQRFPGRISKMADTGLPTSAIELSWGWRHKGTNLATTTRDSKNSAPVDSAAETSSKLLSYETYLKLLADATGAKQAALVRTLQAWTNDNQVQLLTLFWRADL